MEEIGTELDGLRTMEGLLRGRNRVLQLLAQGAPLAQLLETLCRESEKAMPGARCSVLLLDKATRRLRHGAAPSLPPDYVAAVDGLAIGPYAGSCGAAAHHGRRVVVEDVTRHSNWKPYRTLAAAAEIAACWSEPVLSTRSDVLGTFAIYYREPRSPDAVALEVVQRTAQVAGIAIESELAKTELRASEQRFRQLAETIREVFWLTDSETRRVLYISPAYEEVWRRTRESLLLDSRSWLYDVHAEDRERVEVLSRSEEEYETEYRIVWDDGSVRWIYERCFPVRDDEGRIYRYAGISEDVTDRKRTEEALRDANHKLDVAAKQKLRSLTTELLLAEERERRKLAIDLHDSLNQTLVLARMKVADLESAKGGTPQAALADLARLIETATSSARSMTFQLSPPILYDLGFGPAVQWLVENVQESYGVRTRLIETSAELPLDDRVKILLFRAVRELLINVAKHAKAHQAVVSIARQGSSIEIRVRDDGIAFDREKTTRRGLGLGSIEERLENLGGHMAIDARPGHGTVITLVAPLASGELLPDADEPAATSAGVERG